MNIKFKDLVHMQFFREQMARAGCDDSYHQALFYLLGLTEETRRNIDQIYDFDAHVIKPHVLSAGWQTSGTIRVTRLAFNLFNGFTEPELSNGYSPEDLFRSPYMPCMLDAVRIRYP